MTYYLLGRVYNYPRNDPLSVPPGPKSTSNHLWGMVFTSVHACFLPFWTSGKCNLCQRVCVFSLASVTDSGDFGNYLDFPLSRGVYQTSPGPARPTTSKDVDARVK